jgi:hypothetical protein
MHDPEAGCAVHHVVAHHDGGATASATSPASATTTVSSTSTASATQLHPAGPDAVSFTDPTGSPSASSTYGSNPP